MAGMPGKISMSGNEWSLEEIPAEEEILGGRGGGPGRPGGRPLGGRGGGWAAPGNLLGELENPPRGPPWGGPRQLRQMARNGAKIVVFQREPARPPGRNPSPPGAPRLARLAPRGSV